MGDAGRNPPHPPRQVKANPSSPRFLRYRHKEPRRSLAMFSSVHSWVFSPRVKQSPGSDPLLSLPPPAARSSLSSPPYPYAVTLQVLHAQGRTHARKGMEGTGDSGWLRSAEEVQQLLCERDQRHRTMSRTNYSNELPPINKPRAKRCTGRKKTTLLLLYFKHPSNLTGAARTLQGHLYLPTHV